MLYSETISIFEDETKTSKIELVTVGNEALGWPVCPTIVAAELKIFFGTRKKVTLQH